MGVGGQRRSGVLVEGVATCTPARTAATSHKKSLLDARLARSPPLDARKDLVEADCPDRWSVLVSRTRDAGTIGFKASTCSSGGGDGKQSSASRAPSIGTAMHDQQWQQASKDSAACRARPLNAEQNAECSTEIQNFCDLSSTF